MMTRKEALEKFVNPGHGYIVRKEVERVLNALYDADDTKEGEAYETLVDTLELANKTIKMQADEIKALEIDVKGYKMELDGVKAVDNKKTEPPVHVAAPESKKTKK